MRRELLAFLIVTALVLMITLFRVLTVAVPVILEIPGPEENNVLTGYVQFNGDLPFSKRCHTCGIVSSSGTILNTGAGTHIDKNECVIRMNDAPSTGFEKDVGNRTSIRVFGHSSDNSVPNLLTKATWEVKDTTFVVWGPRRNMKPGGRTNKRLISLIYKYPTINVFMYTELHMTRADQIFEYETGKNRITSGAYLSTGWFTILFAREICKNINIYGMIEEDFCEAVKAKKIPDAPYHYYQENPKQCSMYYTHENTKEGAHRFITEKRVFKKWAREWGNVQFHYPEWDLTKN